MYPSKHVHSLKHLLAAVLLCLAAHLLMNQPVQALNPIITTNYSADPSAHVFGGKMYVYPSHDRNDAQEFDMNDYHVYSTDDMANWEDGGVILSLAQIPWAKAHLWAPDCNFYKGRYYLYFPADDTGKYDFKIGAATSASPTGPFVAEPKPIPGANGIDPSVFIDDDGTPYLIWAAGVPTLCKLTPDMKGLSGTPVPLKGCSKFFEGPWLFKRKGLYYLTYPAFQAGGSGDGGSGQNYDYATAKTISGPYTYGGTFTRSRADEPQAGNIHGSQVEWNKVWYCFYHDCSLSNGDPKSGFKRCVKVDLLKFNSDGRLAPLVWTQTGPPKLKNLNPFVPHPAVSLCQSPGPADPLSVQTESCAEGGMDLGSISNGSWVQYANVDFGKGAKTFTARVASPAADSRIELHLDSQAGPLIGTCSAANTGGWQTWKTVTCPVSGAAGVHNLFLTFHAPHPGGLLNLRWFQFGPAARFRAR